MSKNFLALFWVATLFVGPGMTQTPENPLAGALKLIRTGQYERAWRLLEANQSSKPLELRLRIELLDRKGQIESARIAARQLVGLFQQGFLSRTSDLAQVAYAAWYLQQWEEANQIYINASSQPDAPLSLFVDWGNLYLEKYNPSEAESIFRDGLRANPEAETLNRWEVSDLYLGLAKSLKDQSKPGAPAALQKAIEEGPENLAIIAYQVSLSINDESLDKAEELIQKSLELAPNYLPLLELDCVAHYFSEDEEAYLASKQRVFEINNKDANLYELLGNTAVTKRRLEESIDFFDQALKLHPRQWSAMASKGINLLRLGNEEEGVAALEQAYENDPYNIWTVNTLRLVDSFKVFEKFETDNFSVRLHRKEANSLRPYVETLLERSLEKLQERYDHQINEKIVFEMYPDHEDFAVRTLGLPGLGALGATFGRVVAMDSPSARSKGEFHWGSTLWHEMAHVVTISLSNNKVPRWFTEGISMMEERLGGTGWGDALNIGFVKAFEEDKLLPLTDLNSGFMRPQFPGQVAISYFQAGWVCEFINQEYGLEKIRQMLIAFGEGQTIEEVFTTVLGKSVEEVDEQFTSQIRIELEPLVSVLKQMDTLPRELDAIKAALENAPENYMLNVTMGQFLIQKEQPQEAVPYFEKAIELFPHRAGKDSPYHFLVKAYSDLGNEEEMGRILDDWWRRSPLLIENALQLSDFWMERNQLQKVESVLESALFSDPLSQDLHKQLGDLYLKVNAPEKAVQEFRVLLSMNPVDRASAHYDLALALTQSGQKIAARQEILYALEIAPEFEQAQRLLLDLVRQ